MASAQLPAPTLTAAERDDIVARMGGEDSYLAAFTGWLYSSLEARAAAEAREAANATIRDAVEAAAGTLPPSILPVAEAAAEPVA